MGNMGSGVSSKNIESRVCEVELITVMAIYESYNWLFQWDYTFYKWGYKYFIVELRTPATPVGVGGGKERGGCHLNLRTWHAEGRRPILGLCWPSLGLCWPILRLCWPMPMRTKCCNLQHFALWDGKNPCKYNSFSPRKWLKHSYLQSFVHITIFDFLKNV